MTRTEFFELCESNSISANHIHFENSVADGYYVLKNHHRGKDYDCVGFPSESDALIYLADNLMRK